MRISIRHDVPIDIPIQPIHSPHSLTHCTTLLTPLTFHVSSILLPIRDQRKPTTRLVHLHNSHLLLSCSFYWHTKHTPHVQILWSTTISHTSHNINATIYSRLSSLFTYIRYHISPPRMRSMCSICNYPSKHISITVEWGIHRSHIRAPDTSTSVPTQPNNPEYLKSHPITY